MTLMNIFWIFVAFYALVKVSFFIGVYFVTKAVERRALAERTTKARTIDQIAELENVVALYEHRLKVSGKQKAPEQISKRFIS
ncbi:MAG: hypothetical protein HPY50_17725 [Firmicutes bacterium]|nr:hypothetical protein [Bacillota bacterium]